MEKTTPWEKFNETLNTTESLIKKIKTQQINSKKEVALIREFVFVYFRELRPAILNKSIDPKPLDSYFENLQFLSSKRSLRSSYIELFKKIRKKFLEIELQKEYVSSNKLPVSKTITSMSAIENKIYETLSRLEPSMANSYMQLLSDIQDNNKFSFKGSVHELREILREVLLKLAPDDEVKNSKGFVLEKDCSKPTMRQKVIFIFNTRGSPKDEKDIALSSLIPIELGEEAIANLTRGIYTSGSTSAHGNETNKESIRGNLIQLKMYLDAILCHLLEINR